MKLRFLSNKIISFIFDRYNFNYDQIGEVEMRYYKQHAFRYLYIIIFFLLSFDKFRIPIIIYRSTISQRSSSADDLVKYLSEEKKLPFKIYLCSSYFNEVEIFAFKTLALSPYIHKFVLITSPNSISNKISSNITFSPFNKLKEALGSRLFIDVIPLTQTSNFLRENEIRNNIKTALRHVQPQPDPDDIIIVSDFDEFLLEDGIEYLISHPPESFYRFECKFFYYSFRWQITSLKWVHPIACRYKFLNKFKVQKLWKSKKPPVKDIIGYHISYFLRTPERIQKKLFGFSHQFFNHEPFINLNYIYAKASCGLDILTRRQNITIELQPPMNTSKYPYLNHPLLSWMNEKNSFSGIEDLNYTQVKEFGACKEALEHLQKVQSTKYN